MAYDSDKILSEINTSVGTGLNTAVTTLGATARLGAINAIYRGTIVMNTPDVSATATITAVVTARSVLSFLGEAAAASSSPSAVALTNTTTITASRSANTGTTTVGYQVVEYTA